LTIPSLFFQNPELTRSQTLNQADTVNKLREAISEAIRPEKLHIETEEVSNRRGFCQL